MVGGPFNPTTDRGEMNTFPFAGSLLRLRSYETGGETLSLASAGLVLSARPSMPPVRAGHTRSLNRPFAPIHHPSIDRPVGRVPWPSGCRTLPVPAGPPRVTRTRAVEHDTSTTQCGG